MISRYQRRRYFIVIMFTGFIIYSLITTWLRNERGTVEDIFNARKLHLLNFCIDSDVNGTLSDISHGVEKRLIIDRVNNISWCPVYKAGSSKWMKVFANIGIERDYTLEALREEIDTNAIARRAFPYTYLKNIKQIIAGTKKFVIVRHPFERLLSAYRDKLEDTSPVKSWYFFTYSRHILQTYRGVHNQIVAPTFYEFIQYIITEKTFDEHWRPYFIECAPCYVNYDLILKTETLERDQEYLLKYLSIDQVSRLFTNIPENVNPSGRTDIAENLRYFSTIPREMLQTLYRIYEPDFLMFDYKPDEYFAMAQN